VQKVTLDSGITLAYELRGNPSGVPVVFVHGFASRAAGYEPVVQLMEDRYYMLLVDHRGHGDSDKPLGDTYEETRTTYTIQQFRDDLREVIEKIGFPAPFILFGHSMGGMIALEFILTFPALVSHLVLGSTLATYHTDNMVELVRQFKSGAMKADEGTYRMMIGMQYTLAFKKAHPEFEERELQDKLIVPPDVYVACLENFVNGFDVRDRLGEIQQPTLVITGNRDALIQWTNSEFLAEHLPNAKLVVIPKMNHVTIHEVPEIMVRETDSLVGL
jgi:pimeloyl-ACP methyl ester carboxylesterase